MWCDVCVVCVVWYGVRCGMVCMVYGVCGMVDVV